MKLEFFWKDKKKHSNIKFHENLSSGSRVVPCGWADRWPAIAKLISLFEIL
jgi:hypothetical protein